MTTFPFDPALYPDVPVTGAPGTPPIYTPPPLYTVEVQPDADHAPPAPPAAQQQTTTPPAGGAGLAEELAVLDPKPVTLTLTSGTRVTIKKLKTRGLLSLLAIGLAGVGNQLNQLRLDADDDPEVFMGKFLGLVFLALPHAQDETIEFLRVICEPADKVKGRKISKEQRERNKELDEALDLEFEDPEPDDSITLVETVITQNGGSLQTWGKRLAGVLRLAMRTGRIPASPKSPVSTGSAV